MSIKQRKVKIVICLVAMIIWFSFFFSNICLADDIEEEEGITAEEIQKEVLETAVKPVTEPSLNARSAIVYDRTTQTILYEKNSNTKIYLESIYPVNNSLNKEIVETRTNDNIKDLNNKIEKICNNNKCTYINMYDNLTDKNGNMKRIYTVDGLHLNKIGYKAVASKLTKYLNE